MVETLKEQLPTTTSTDKDWQDFQDELQKIALFQQQILRGEQGGSPLQEELKFSSLTVSQRGELTALAKFADNLKLDRRRLSKLAQFYDEIDQKKLGRSNVNEELKYSKLTPIQREDIINLARLSQGLVENSNRLGNFINIFEQILNNSIINLTQLSTALKFSDLTFIQKDELRKFLMAVKKAPQDIKQLLVGSYQNNFKTLENYMNSFSMRDSSDVDKQKTMSSLVDDITQTFRGVSTEKRILDQLIARQVEQAIKEIPTLPNLTPKDREVVTNLTNLAFKIRKQQAMKSLYKTLSDSEINFTQALTIIKNFPADENQDQDQEQIRELNNFVLDLNRRVTEGRILTLAAPFGADINKVVKQIEDLPIKCKEDFDFKINLKARIKEMGRNRTLVNLRVLFNQRPASVVLPQIEALKEEEPEDIELKTKVYGEYRQFIKFRKNLRPLDYDLVFAKEIDELLQSLEKDKLKVDKIGKNLAAFRYLKRKYRETLYALVETFREDPETRDEMERIVPKFKFNGSPALEYRRRVRDLTKQRELTEIEKAYFESIESLTFFAPYLVGVALADIGTTSVFLQSHFESLSQKTIAGIKDGDYFPLIQIGTGPNGMISIGEIVRKNPRLASQMLVVDQGPQPGGPFAIPNGPAWNLNSANLVGRKSITDKPSLNEEKTVRAFGSPERWYPGERRANKKDTRTGSINKLVDYFPDPDDLSTKRYPSNEELQIMLALQAVLCIDKLALNTRVVKVEGAKDSLNPDRKLVTLSMNGKIVQILTDNLIASTGLGEPNFGFPLEDKRAQKVLAEIKDQPGLKKVTTTLEAFRGLADRIGRRPTVGLGGVIGIYGVGNSSDTLIEYLGRLFDSENPDVKNVEKLYVIATGTPTKRPRYRQIDDLRERIGRGNVISSVQARVGDFDFENRRESLDRRKIVLYDQQDKLIKDDSGEIIRLDNLIAATGFRSSINKVLESLKGERVSVNLPTNSKVSVADTLSTDPSVLIIGTASSPKFNDEKLSQLPKTSRDDLVRVGAENAVAIGFRGPDTQAAVNIFLQNREFKLVEESVKEKEAVDVGQGTQIFNSLINYGPANIDRGSLRIQDNADEKRILSAFLGKLFGDVQAVKNNSPFTGMFQFELAVGKEGDSISLRPSLKQVYGMNTPLSELFGLVKNKLQDDYVQRYALSLLQRARGQNPSLTLNLGFKKGRIDIANTYIP